MIVVDCEMSGVNPLKNGIIQIGAVEIENPSNHFYIECRIDDDQEVNNDTSRYLEISEDDMRDASKISVKEAIEAFMAWALKVNDRTLIVHTFMDIMFFEIACRKYQLDFLSTFGYHFVELHSVAYAHYVQHGYDIPNKNGLTYLRASDIARFVGIPEEPKPHKAINGALYEGETFFRLVYKRNLFPEFSEFPLPEYLV